MPIPVRMRATRPLRGTPLYRIRMGMEGRSIGFLRWFRSRIRRASRRCSLGALDRRKAGPNALGGGLPTRSARVIFSRKKEPGAGPGSFVTIATLDQRNLYSNSAEIVRPIGL